MHAQTGRRREGARARRQMARRRLPDGETTIDRSRGRRPDDDRTPPPVLPVVITGARGLVDYRGRWSKPRRLCRAARRFPRRSRPQVTTPSARARARALTATIPKQ